MFARQRYSAPDALPCDARTETAMASFISHRTLAENAIPKWQINISLNLIFILLMRG